jgi:uncharacterized membrane protein YagU involved in acid resistance
MGSRALVGAIAGIAGTAIMSAAMQRLWERLPARERYPLPPREITEQAIGAPEEDAARNRSLAAHVGFGAATGALLTLADADRTTGRGMAAGVAVWLASYFGWVPGARILRPASSHPLRRNLLMIGVHLVWGGATALTARNLERFRTGALAEGRLKDAPRPSKK